MILDIEQIYERIEVLRAEHRMMDAEIAALESKHAGQLEIARLKRKKLAIRDELTKLESTLHPDLIA